jgi:hypothetical protein
MRKLQYIFLSRSSSLSDGGHSIFITSECFVDGKLAGKPHRRMRKSGEYLEYLDSISDSISSEQCSDTRVRVSIFEDVDPPYRSYLFSIYLSGPKK